MKISIPSLELRWLNYPKDISIPDIIIVGKDEYEYGGCYYEPEKTEVWVTETPYPLDRGVLIVREDCYEGTLCHEFRHHIQRTHMGIQPDVVEFKFDLRYKDAVIEYFTQSMTERDALMYELKHYPNEHTLEWYEWLVKHYENNTV